MGRSRFRASPVVEAFVNDLLGRLDPAETAAFVAEITGQRNPARSAAFVEEILGGPTRSSTAAFVADILREYSPDQPRDDWGRWTSGGSSGDRSGGTADEFRTRPEDFEAKSNPETGVYQIGGGHRGQICVAGDSLLNRGAFDRVHAAIVVTAVRNAADRIEKSIDLLENHFSQVQACARGTIYADDKVMSDEGRAKMLVQLKTVRDALNNPSVYTNIILDSENSGEERKAYVTFLARDRGPAWSQFSTNIVTSSIHVTPFFFSSKVLPAEQATSLQHELGRYYNSLGETGTGTWNDVHAWDNRIDFLNKHYEEIKGSTRP